MSTKTCSCCGVDKRIEDFQVRRASVDGRTASCKACLKARDAARYPEERDRRRVLRQAYMATPAGKAAHRRAVRHWWAARPERRAAHIAVGNALRAGLLLKEPCACCGAVDVEAHHPDYSAPLAVVWLCVPHHKQLHEEHEIFLAAQQTFC